MVTCEHARDQPELMIQHRQVVLMCVLRRSAPAVKPPPPTGTGCVVLTRDLSVWDSVKREAFAAVEAPRVRAAARFTASVVDVRVRTSREHTENREDGERESHFSFRDTVCLAVCLSFCLSDLKEKESREASDVSVRPK